MSETNSSKPDQSIDDGLYSYDSFGQTKKTSETNFLWWCAGAHQRLLKLFPSEHTKYSGLGGVLLATFALATLSAGFALHTIFFKDSASGFLWTILIALVWGFIIFNFDRFLVSTMRKYGVSRRKQLWMAFPRLALALLIGLVIARPLELKIFEKEINVKMTENLHKKIHRNDSLLAQEFNNQMNGAKDERLQLQIRKQAIEDTLHQLQLAYVQEADGTGGSQQRGIENITRLKMDAYNQAKIQFTPELLDIDIKIGQQDSLLRGANENMEVKRDEYEKAAIANMGFLERNKALSDLADEESSVWWSSFLISMLIILIEIGPVLSKLIMPLGPYDVALAKEELIQMAADENDIRKNRQFVFEKRKSYYQKQKELSDELVNKLTELQQKNIDKELDKWERGEWEPDDHRASMDEVMKKIKSKYQFRDDDLL